MVVRVAFSTDDGKLLVDDHFGEGKYFHIYDIGRDTYRLVDIRENKSGEEREHGDPLKAKKIAEILRDVDVLVGYRMGPNINRMKKRFLPIVSRTRDIHENIKLITRNMDEVMKLLNEKNIIVIMEKDGKIRIVR